MAKILVVDDDKLIRKGLVDMLVAEGGFEVTSAEDGEAGLQLALVEHPDLIITDMRMPRLTGAEMVTKIRQDEWGKAVPIIMMSNDENTAAINEALSAGVTTYLSKTNTDRGILIQQINTVLTPSAG